MMRFDNGFVFGACSEFLEEAVDTMCNFGEGIEERGIEKRIEKGIVENPMEKTIELMKKKIPGLTGCRWRDCRSSARGMGCCDFT